MESKDHVGETDESGLLVVEFPEGTLRACARSATRMSSAMSETILRGSREQHIELMLDAVASVRGHVSDARTGEPLEGVRVSAPTVSELEYTETDRGGDYAIAQFPATGRGHRVVFRKAGFASALRVLTISEKGDWTILAAPGSDKQRAGLVVPAEVSVALAPELRIEGTVIDPSGAPISDAAVSVEGYFHLMPSAATPDLGQGRTDAGGHYSIGGLRADISHSLLVSSPPYGQVVVELPSSSTFLCSVEPIMLEKGSSVSGLVLDPAGRPAADVEVRITFADRAAVRTPENIELVDAAGIPVSADAGQRVQGKYRQTRTDLGGAFEIGSLVAGHYTLQARGERSSSLVTTSILLKPAEKQTETLQLPATCITMSGTLARNGTPLVGARILVQRDGWSTQTITREDGKFWVAALDDTSPYELSVNYTDPLTGAEWEAQQPVWATACPDIELHEVPK